MGSSTRERLLDAAERLYSEQGIDATSLRAITAAADANLAAVHYHFGSKQALTEAVFGRRIVPLNEQRISRLDELERGGEPVALSDIIEAFILPAFTVGRDPVHGGERFVRLMGRIYTEPGGELNDLLVQQFGSVMRRFTRALERALPHLSREEVLWRFHFMVGTMIHTVADPVKIGRLSGGLCDPEDVEGVTRRMVAFLAGGLRAPLPGAPGVPEPPAGRVGHSPAGGAT